MILSGRANMSMFEPACANEGFVGAATTTLALFAYRLESVLLLAHKAGSKLSLCHISLAQGSLKNSRFCRILVKQNKSKTA
jgi:hypothetical protein